MKNYLMQLLLTMLVMLGFTRSAFALDVSDLVTAIEGAATPIGLIGSAVLVVIVGVKVFKWVRSAI